MLSLLCAKAKHYPTKPGPGAEWLASDRSATSQYPREEGYLSVKVEGSHHGHGYDIGHARKQLNADARKVMEAMAGIDHW